MRTRTATLEVNERPDELEGLAADIRNRHRSLLLEVRIETHEGGVLLFGRAVTFYGKQMAQEELLRRGFIVKENNLVVAGPSVRWSSE
jgi:hypothetical protein